MFFLKAWGVNPKRKSIGAARNKQKAFDEDLSIRAKKIDKRREFGYYRRIFKSRSASILLAVLTAFCRRNEF
jgi:hypothetical protein